MPAPEPDTPAGREVPATENTANAAARPAITGPEASAPMSTPAPDITNAAEPGNIAKAANVLRTAPSAAPTASVTTSPINAHHLLPATAFTVTAIVPAPAVLLPQAVIQEGILAGIPAEARVAAHQTVLLSDLMTGYAIAVLPMSTKHTITVTWKEAHVIQMRMLSLPIFVMTGCLSIRRPLLKTLIWDRPVILVAEQLKITITE